MFADNDDDDVDCMIFNVRQIRFACGVVPQQRISHQSIVGQWVVYLCTLRASHNDCDDIINVSIIV